MAAMVERKCKCCKTSFKARAADVNRGWGVYCSKSCKAVVQERKNGQHAAYRAGRGVSNLHPERLTQYSEWNAVGEYDTHPFSSEGLGQWN